MAHYLTNGTLFTLTAPQPSTICTNCGDDKLPWSGTYGPLQLHCPGRALYNERQVFQVLEPCCTRHGRLPRKWRTVVDSDAKPDWWFSATRWNSELLGQLWWRCQLWSRQLLPSQRVLHQVGQDCRPRIWPSRSLNFYCKVSRLVPTSWIVDPGSRILDPGSGIQGGFWGGWFF